VVFRSALPVCKHIVECVNACEPLGDKPGERIKALKAVVEAARNLIQSFNEQDGPYADVVLAKEALAALGKDEGAG